LLILLKTLGIGIDISQFNCTITEVKLQGYDIDSLSNEIRRIERTIAGYESDSNITAFENELMEEMLRFNTKYFPTPEYKYNLQRRQIDEGKFAVEKEKEFLKIYEVLVDKYKIQLRQQESKTFLDKWYIKNVRDEINFAYEQINKIEDIKVRKVLSVILSRTIRSCRATTHSDLATLKEPQLTTYYCTKHKKICKPLFSIKYWFNRYAFDTIYRLKTFAHLKTDSFYAIIPADSRNIDIFKEVERTNKRFYEILKNQKIRGIFTSPPYVGLIDYHEQHAYAYDLFGFERKDNLEIGPLFKGQGIEARKSYVQGIADVLNNCKKYMVDDFDVFLVANDKYRLYPTVAERAGMQIVNQFKRPVLNRTEKDKGAYSESIFHLKRR